MRRKAAVYAAVGALLAVIVVFRAFPLRGRWIDDVLSEKISREASIPVRLFESSIESWKEVRFKLLLVESRSKVSWVASGPGRLRLLSGGPFDPVRTMLLEMKSLAILEDFYRRSSVVAWVSKRAFRDPIYVERLVVRVKQTEAGLSCRILRFDSEEVILRGGFVLKRDGRIAKADLFVLVPGDRFEEIPKEVRARMIRRANGWRGVRVLSDGKSLTVLGTHGPFFRAEWKPLPDGQAGLPAGQAGAAS